MKVAFVLLLLAVAGLAMDPNAVRAKHNAHMSTAVQKLQEMPGRVKGTMGKLTKPDFSLQTATPQDIKDCESAYMLWAAVWNSSVSQCYVVGEIWSQNLTQAQLGAVVNQYCVALDAQNHTCQQKVDYAWNQFVTNCTRAGILNASEVESERVLIAASKITCLQDTYDGHFCMNDFYTLSHTNTSNLNDTVLATICVPCTRQVLQTLLWFAPKDVLKEIAYLDLICLQVANEFCFTKFVDALVVMAAGGDFSDAKAQIWCHPCVEQFVFRYVATIQVISGPDDPTIAEELVFIAFHKFMCVQNKQGYCFPQIQAANASFDQLAANCGAHAVVNDTCPSACLSTIQGIKNTLGCCFGTWFNMIRFQFATNATFRQTLAPLTPMIINDFISYKCQVTVPMGCSNDRLDIKLYLAGLDATWVQQHQDQIHEAVLAYLMFVLSCDNTTISNLMIGPDTTHVVSGASVHHLMQASTPTVATFSYRADSQQQSDNAQQNLSPNVMANPSTACLVQLPLESRSNISQPCNAQSASVTVVPDTSSAFAKAPTFVTLLFGIFALLML